MVSIALMSYLVIIKIFESDEYRECSSQLYFPVTLSQSILEAEDFPFFSMGKCENSHSLRTIVKMAYWIFSSILLNNYCFTVIGMIYLPMINYQKRENCKL